jgi:hypothetical protein
MAGGPFLPSEPPIPLTAPRVFPNIHICAGSNHKHHSGIAWQASVGADATWRMAFRMPTTLPSGTAKFSGLCLANATTGDAKLNIKWASAAKTEDPSSLTLNAEGVSTLTWASGDNDKYKELLVTLDADTVVADEIIVLDIVGETSGWTLAQVMTMCNPCVLFV